MLENGTVCCKKEEAETVVWIYEQYAAGESYRNLTDKEKAASPYRTEAATVQD